MPDEYYLNVTTSPDPDQRIFYRLLFRDASLASTVKTGWCGGRGGGEGESLVGKWLVSVCGVHV